MVRRLLFVLLIGWLAVPAVAMPIAPQMPDAAVAGHCNDMMPDAPAPDQLPGKALLHGCIGCLAPLSGLDTPPPAPPAPAPNPHLLPPVQLAGLVTVPEVPPPRA
jgi:hypothetical protein